MAPDQCLAVDEQLVPTGELFDVADGPLDFNTLRTIRCRIDEAALPGNWRPGYDHAFKLRSRDSLAWAATVHDPQSGRLMEVHTTYSENATVHR